MHLQHFMHIGYGLVIGTFLLMIWISYVESKEMEFQKYPPCFFNSFCKCSKSMPDLGIVHCENVHLPRIPESINISKVFKLHLINNGLRTLEPYFLQSTGLYKIEISNNPLYVIPDEAFMGLGRSLWELDLSHNHLTVVPTRAMKYLQKLKMLDLTGNDIIKVTSDNWRGLGNTLQTLVLADNSITNLPTDLFSGLNELDTIDLTGNNLKEIDPSVFRDGMAKLTNLLLGHNQLGAIPYQAISPLKTLKDLDLSYNKITSMNPATEVGIQNVNYNFVLNLDELRLDYNQITEIPTASFQLFNVLNKTYLDGNNLRFIGDNAFRQAKIKELYMRRCSLTELSPIAFDGLEDYLEILDLSGNNLQQLPIDLFDRMVLMKSLSLGDNQLKTLSSADLFNSFLFTLNHLDVTGNENSDVSLQDIRRLKGLRFLSLTKINKNTLGPDDFKEFGVDLEELDIVNGGLQTIQSHTFRYVHGLKRIDFSENGINSIESNALYDIGHSLVSLKLSHGLSSSMQNIPADPLKQLTHLEELDLSNNRIRNVPDTSFHFLKKLRTLELQDNIIENLQKGTFQGDIHSELEEIYLSFNNIRTIKQHTFVELPSLQEIFLDDNKIESLERRAFMNLENLKELDLKGNRISQISYETFQNLPELEYLDISYNKMTKFDFTMFDQVGTLAMFHVNMSHNNLKNLHFGSTEAEFGAMGAHTNVKVLDLSFNNISSISRAFFKPAELSLTHLYISSNKILNVSMEVFGNMPHLQLLDISDNMIYELDFDTFRNTKRLQILDASNNRIADVPNDLFRFLKEIRIVNFSRNRLRALPDNLFREDAIEHVDLSHNIIGKLPLNSFSVPAARNLYELDLSWNSISSLSHGGMFSRFQSLNWLDLSHNRLAQIDAGTFRELPRLSSLDLSNNVQLTLEPNGLTFHGLEDSLIHLNLDNVSLSQVPLLPTPHLISLSLADNYLPTVPPEMATNLSALCELNLNNNDLTSVPIVTHSLPELRYLYMADNPITSLSNTSLLGVADSLKELDIRNLDINELEAGAFCKLCSLKTLALSFYRNLKNYNIPKLLINNCGLEELEVNVDFATEDNLEKIMAGNFPTKLSNLTFSGTGLKKLGPNVFKGIRSPVFHLCLQNTSITNLGSDLFKNFGEAENVTIDVSENPSLKVLHNPSTGSKPVLHRKTFLLDLEISGSNWNCDCELGWIEVWLRKKRQYLCSGSSHSSIFDDCRHASDYLRNAQCGNRNNQSLLEILKTDIECGWSLASSYKYSSVLILIALVFNWLTA
ncbi:chaoptin [Harmonia axyridis]|uniref:chaoptin n=1 Tax=Harmonia axyridis TaxID=115357 RepID=UPI001E27680F|nr:chaoptin [Harmonia axyridis]